MPPVRLSVARGRLLAYDTGVNRRLLYLASGDDVGCSVALFWYKCDSFYLVDPELGVTVHYAGIPAKLNSGLEYMAGLRVAAAPDPEVGVWDGIVPGRRYQVWTLTNPGLRKRLCFAQAGTNLWLASTNTRYNVIVVKDYAGFDGVDSDLPYALVWDKLNYGGIFAETIGKMRSSAACDFAKYRYLGFDPMFTVESETGAQVGFAQGLWLFQKVVDNNEGNYRQRQAELDALFTAITNALEVVLSDFVTKRDDLHALGTQAALVNFLDNNVPATTKMWSAVGAMPAFANWVLTQLPARYAHTPTNLVLDLLSGINLMLYGAFRE